MRRFKNQPVAVREVVNHAVAEWYRLTGLNDVPYKLLMAITTGVFTDGDDNWRTYVSWRLANAAAMVPRKHQQRHNGSPLPTFRNGRR